MHTRVWRRNALFHVSPSRTKTAMASKIRYGQEIRNCGSKTLQRVLRNASFSQGKSKKTVQIGKDYGASKLRVRALDGRNSAMVIAESLARVIASVAESAILN